MSAAEPSIESVHARQILDSRGRPTVEVNVRLTDGALGRASVPSERSTGTHEAHERRDGDPGDYAGLGVHGAVNAVRDELAPALRGKAATDQQTIDALLRDLDGTASLSRLGANAVLGTSLAVCRARRPRLAHHAWGSPRPRAAGRHASRAIRRVGSMRVVIAGGHGKIALLAERLLAGRGDQVAGLIRNPAQAAEVQQAGAEAVVCDLETASAEDVAVLLSGAAAVVFAAGAGPGSGASRKDSVDRGASVLMADAAERAGVRRFVQISSMGAGQPPQPGTDEVWAAYITAKTAAEDDLRSRDLDWTILRPGGLTDAPATGRIHLAAPPVPAGTIPRADVAAVIAALLDEPGTRRQTLELVAGDSPVAAAVRSIS